MGYYAEYLRPDAVSYIRPLQPLPNKKQPPFSPEFVNAFFFALPNLDLQAAKLAV